jgi:peptide/nickel transport system substrate-binding protein
MSSSVVLSRTANSLDKKDGIHMNRLLRRRRAAAVFTAACMVVGATGMADASAGVLDAGSGSNSLTIAWASDPDTLNPATTGARDVGPLDVNMFDTLTWVTKAGAASSDLATKWAVSNGGKTYTFTLRKGVTFADGTPFNAAAVVANVKYITAKATLSNIALGLLGPCTTAKAVSTYSVAFSCSTPYAPLLAQLGEPYLGIQSPQAIEKYGKTVGDHPDGTGPFEFVSYTPNQSLVLKRNPNYKWAPPALGSNGPAKLENLTFDFVSSDGSRVSELESGQAQLAVGLPGVYYKKFAGTYTDLPVPISGMGIFAPIDAGKFPTNDVNVRRAILYSINKPAVLKTEDSVYPPIYAPLEQGLLGYSSSVAKEYPFDPAKASSILTQDGWKKVNGTWTKGGKQLALVMTVIAASTTLPIAQAMQGELQTAGMKVSLVQQAVPAWTASNLNAQMSLTPLEYVAVDPDALHLWYLPKQYYNWSHYTNPQLTNLINEGQVTSGPSRAGIYQKAQQIIMSQALELPLYQNLDLVTMAKDLKGVTYEGGGFEDFYQAQFSS